MSDDMVTIPRAEFVVIEFDAEQWRRYWQPDMVALRAEQAAWEERRAFCEASSAVSAAVDWGKQAYAPSHVELMRRRAELIVPRRCPGPDCRFVFSVPYPAPAELIYCSAHKPERQKKAA
jgi:hypothetical protein